MGIQRGKLATLATTLSDVPIDIFIASASFEDRCFSIADSLDNQNVKSALIGINLTYHDAVNNNFDQLCAKFGNRATKLDLYSDDPVRSANNIAEIVGKSIEGESKRILIDITTFTRECLILLIGFLRSALRKDDKIQFVYAHAKEYSVGDAPEAKWLSKGIRDVRSILGFPGRMMPSRRTHLIVLVGFEDERAPDLIRECEPSFVSLGIGDSREDGTAPHQDTNVHRFSKLKSILNRVDEFTFQAYDPTGTKNALRQQISKFAQCNVVLAPMNTKISTIGATMLAIEDDSIQLCYAPANIYNVTNYSVPDDDYYLLELSEFVR